LRTEQKWRNNKEEISEATEKNKVIVEIKPRKWVKPIISELL
jgi:hypothetical protein